MTTNKKRIPRWWWSKSRRDKFNKNKTQIGWVEETCYGTAADGGSPFLPRGEAPDSGQGLCGLQPAENAPPMPMVKLPMGVDVEFDKGVKPSDEVMARVTSVHTSRVHIAFNYDGLQAEINVWLDIVNPSDAEVSFGLEEQGCRPPHLSDLRDIAHVAEYLLQQQNN